MNANTILSNEIRADSSGRGALPTELDAEEGSGREAAQALKRILLVDDDQGVRETLGRVLESEDYQVTLAGDGREAAARFLKRPFDLVLLDLNMPNKDGWDAFHLMNTVNPMLPVIIITARPNQYPQALRMGVDALMEKPLNLPLLLRTIENLLAEPEAERTRRLTNPEFKTAFLNRPPASEP